MQETLYKQVYTDDMAVIDSNYEKIKTMPGLGISLLIPQAGNVYFVNDSIAWNKWRTIFNKFKKVYYYLYVTPTDEERRSQYNILDQIHKQDVYDFRT